MDIIAMEDELVKKISDLKDDIEAIQQPRSDFAIEHFVVGMHDTPGRQRMQAVLELQIKMFNIRRVQLQEKKLRIEIEQLAKINDDLSKVSIEEKELDIAEMNLARLGAIREAMCLLSILDRLPRYTYEQLQAEEVQYWQARLSRQAMQDAKSIGTIGAGNAEAITQMFREIGAQPHSLPSEQLQALGLMDRYT